MSKKNILRFISLLSFLLFFCPFFQMCSDEALDKYSLKVLPPTEETVEESIAIVKTPDNIATDTLSPQKSKRIESHAKSHSLDEDRKKVTLNAYQLGSKVFGEKKITIAITDSGFILFSLYSLILLISLMIVITSFATKYKTVLYLSILNLFLAVTSVLLFVLDGSLDDITQIKFGYYLFLANCIAIIIFAKKLKNQALISTKL